MDRRATVIAVAACLLIGMAGWLFWPRPDPLAGLHVDTELLTIKSITIDGQVVPDWPSEMEAGKSYQIDVTGRVRPDDETPADAKIYPPNRMTLTWIPRDGMLTLPWNRNSGEGASIVSLTNEQDTTHVITFHGDEAVARPKPPQAMPKPVDRDSPDADRSFVGAVRTPESSGQYDLLLAVPAASARPGGSLHSEKPARRWIVTLE